MIEPLAAIRSLAELQSKFQTDKLFNFETTAEALLAAAQNSMAAAQNLENEHPMISTPSSDSGPSNNFDFGFESGEPVNAKVIEYRGENVAGFELNGVDMICLPQVYELFLKSMVGGLHTVYTKLKRLEIMPIVCNVEQVRALRSLGAIQPGVNRCKLIASADFDRLYDDCTNTSRPGRPPKRMNSMDEWTAKQPKYEQGFTESTDFTAGSSTMSNPSLFLGQFLPSFTAHQLLMQQMMSMAAAQKEQQQQNSQLQEMRTAEEAADEVSISPVTGPSDAVTPLNLTKSNQNSETSDNDSLENMRKEDDSISPNQSMSSERGESSGGSSGGSSSTHNTTESMDTTTNQALSKIIALVDMANEQFKQERASIQRDKEEIENMRSTMRKYEVHDIAMKRELEEERRKTRMYFRRYCNAKREALTLKERLIDLTSTRSSQQ